MIKRINHLGVIVKNVEEAMDLYAKAFGFRQSGELLTVPEEGLKTVFISIGDVTIELFEPIDPKSGLAKFIEKRGEGLHHISLEVDNIDQELDSLAKEGIELIDRKARPFKGAKLAFVHPQSTKGVLIELLQRAEPEEGGSK